MPQRSEAVRAALGEPLRFAYGDSVIEGLDVYPPMRLMRRWPFLSTAAPGARAGRATTPSPPTVLVPAGAHLVVPDFAAVQDVDGSLAPMARAAHARAGLGVSQRAAFRRQSASASTCWAIPQARTWPACC